MMMILQDGLFLVTNSIDLVKSYPLAVLTPNVNEYKRLVQKVLNCEVDEENAGDQLRSLAKQLSYITLFTSLDSKTLVMIVNVGRLCCSGLVV